MNIKIAGISRGQNAHLLKLNHPMDLINLAMIALVIKLNKCPSVSNWLIFGNKLF